MGKVNQEEGSSESLGKRSNELDNGYKSKKHGSEISWATWSEREEDSEESFGEDRIRGIALMYGGKRSGGGRERSRWSKLVWK